MKNYSIVLAELFFSWGYLIKPPYLSLGGHSLPYPPPTTLIGALAYPYFKYIGLNKEIEFINNKPHSSSVKLLEYVKYASMGYLNPMTTQIVDINKYYIFAYVRDDYRKDETRWTSVIGVGKTYVLSKAVVAYLVEREYSELLSKIAWGISRIGSKESIVSVNKVYLITEPSVLKQTSKFETVFPTPASIVKKCDRAEKVVFWKTTPEVYSKITQPLTNIYEEYFVPKPIEGIYGGKMVIEIDQERAVAFQTPHTPLAVPIELIEESGGKL